MKTSCRKSFSNLVAALGILIILFAFLPSNIDPPWPVQRKEQRRLVRQRVESIGGWEALRTESLAAFGSNEFSWQSSQYSEFKLPNAIDRLRPQRVLVYAIPGEPLVAHIKVFGGHSTGDRGVPYYGLLIVLRVGPNDFVPKPDRTGLKVQRLADSVFEVF